MGAGTEPRRERVLLVEDDQPLAKSIQEFLEQNGFSVRVEGRGDRAVARVLEEQPDLVVLDVMLPGEDGLSVCRRLRKEYQGKILMLTARGDEQDEVVGLDTGADDYLSKPVRPRILLARLRALRRREAQPVQAPPSLVRAGSLLVDPATRTARVGSSALVLTSGEFDLLYLLASHAGRSVTREFLHESLHGVSFDELDRSVDLRVSRLRQKLSEFEGGREAIKTVRGVGYLLTWG